MDAASSPPLQCGSWQICRLDESAREEARLLWPTAWDDYLHWQAEDPRTLDRVNALLKECMREPFRGTGKPEPLGKNLSGWWSRRINREHRLVYRVTGKGDAQALEVAQCRYHY